MLVVSLLFSQCWQRRVAESELLCVAVSRARRSQPGAGTAAIEQLVALWCHDELIYQDNVLAGECRTNLGPTLAARQACC